MFINNIDINICSYNTRVMTVIYMWIFHFTIFKDYVTGLEVLARLLYYLFQGSVIESSHSAFIHYIEVELVATKCIQKNTCFLSLLLEIHFILRNTSFNEHNIHLY